MLNKKTTLFVAVFWTLIVTFLSLSKLGNISLIGSSIKMANKDKIVHFVFYFVFILVWMYYFSKSNYQITIPKILIFTIGYGILMEICQGVFTTYRTADIFDVFANSTGAIFGLILYKSIKNNR